MRTEPISRSCWETSHLEESTTKKFASCPQFPDSLSCAPIFRRITNAIFSFFHWIYCFFPSCFHKTPKPILMETKEILLKGFYLHNGLKCDLQTSLRYSAEHAKSYAGSKLIRALPLYEETEIAVTKEDPLQSCLPFANAALIYDQQDEEIRRRTGIEYIREKNPSLWPLSEDRVVFSPNVPVFRKNQSEKYALMKKPGCVSLISTLPGKMKQRVWNELCAAYDNGCEYVIFSIDGTIPPLFYLNILQNYFSGAFKKVIFAIMDSKNYTNYKNVVSQFDGKIIFT